MYIFQIVWYSYYTGLGSAVVRADNAYEAVTQVPVWDEVFKEVAREQFGEEMGPIPVNIDWLKEAADEVELSFTMEDVTEPVLKMVEPLVLQRAQDRLASINHTTSDPLNGASPV